MKKRIYLTLTLGLTIILFVKGQNNSLNSIPSEKNTTQASITTGWDEYGLNGKVKRITTKSSHAEKKEGKWRMLSSDESSSSSFITEVSFDNLGKTTKSTLYRNTFTLGSLEFKYEDNSLTKILSYDKNGLFKSTKRISLNSPYLQKSQAITFNSEGKISSRSTYKWQNKRIIERVTVSEKNDKEESYYKFIFKDNKEVSRIIKSKKENTAPEITNNEYEYLAFDENGNWIKRGLRSIETNQNVRYRIEVRVIEYY